MNWIKSNPFVSTLTGVTVIICAILAFFATKSGARYAKMKSSFDDSFQNVSKFEKSELYPTAENRAAKTKALIDYRENIENLRELFDGYRPGELERISPQEFTVRLKEASKKVTSALKSSGCEVADDFFLGFESYGKKLANSDATPLLDYQLKGFEAALLALSEARPSKIVRIYREAIPEESGAKYEVDENEVSRNFSMELTFRGSEDSARKFLSALGKTKPNYYIVRAISILNENSEPPKVSDASFEKSSIENEAEESGASPFGNSFVFPSSEEGDSEEGPEEEAAVIEEAPAAEIDTTRILAQVLGGEEILVFVRFDLTLFTPKEELPKP